MHQHGGVLAKPNPERRVWAQQNAGSSSRQELPQKPQRQSRRRAATSGIVFFAVAVTASFTYPHLLGRYTYPQRSDLSSRHISASETYLTSDAQQYKRDHPDAGAEELNQNLPDGDIWTRTGIERAELWLLAAYACLVLSLSGAIFSLLEANLRGKT